MFKVIHKFLTQLIKQYFWLLVLVQFVQFAGLDLNLREDLLWTVGLLMVGIAIFPTVKRWLLYLSRWIMKAFAIELSSLRVQFTNIANKKILKITDSRVWLKQAYMIVFYITISMKLVMRLLSHRYTQISLCFLFVTYDLFLGQTHTKYVILFAIFVWAAYIRHYKNISRLFTSASLILIMSLAVARLGKDTLLVERISMWAYLFLFFGVLHEAVRLTIHSDN